MANQWFKFYGAEYLSDPKMDRLTVQERSCWLTLLCMASQSGGVVKYISTEGLLMKSGIVFNPYDSTEWDQAQNVLKTFETYGMINVDANGFVTVKNWNKRQDHYMTNAERQAKYRENKKSNEKVTKRVTKVTLEENRIEENRINTAKKTKVYIKSNESSIIEDMYNYVECDDNGNPLRSKRFKARLTKDQNNFLIKVGLLWQEMCAKKLDINKTEVPLNNIYYAIRSCYDRSKFTYEDFKGLFDYFFNDKAMKEENKTAFDLCLSEKYVMKYKLSKRKKEKEWSQASLASEMSL